jgi:hypothetical protein
MADQERKLPRLAEEGARRVEERQDRQARALRENLLRRKAQQRARATGSTSPSSDEGGHS